MRIVIAAQTYRPATNGAAVFANHLATGLARAGHEVVVLMPSNRVRAYEERWEGVRIRGVAALPLLPFYPEIYVTLFCGREVGRLLDALQPDVVHIHDHYPLSRAVLGASRARGLPVVGTNNFLPENLVSQMPALPAGRALLERLLWKMVLDPLDRVEVVTAASETSAAILRQQGLRPPVRAISCGVDLGRFHPDPTVDRAATRWRYGLDPGRAVFLYVGRLDPDKRLDVLLHAMQRLLREDLQLAVVGRGRQMGALQGLAARLGLDAQVRFTGYVPDDDLPALLNSADVFVMPSEAELQCLAALEAMATARPLLAADARALPELVADGVNGYLFRAGDAADAARRMAQLMAEQQRWAEMGAASLEMARPHSIANTVRRYEELYGQIAGSRP
jgi:glycosyltransferase involved in cell wall biosynthesis